MQKLIARIQRVGGTRGPDPPGITRYMGFLMDKAIGSIPPPVKKLDTPLPGKNVGMDPPLERWKIINFL